MGASMTVSGDRAVSKRFKNIAKRASDVSPAWRGVGGYLSRMVAQQFASEGSRLGTPWRPLKPEYRLWKMQNGYSRKILVQTGRMKQSFTGRPMDIERYGPSDAVFGSNDMKAVWHHFGTHKDGKQVNPARPILVVTPEIRREVSQRVIKYIAKGR